LQLQAQPVTDVSITLGLRYDFNTRFEGTFNPRLGLVWNPADRFTLKVLYGSAYLAPSTQYTFDRFGNFISDDGGLTYRSEFYQLPNADLEPQLIDTYELSARFTANEHLSLTATGHYSDIVNIINPVLDTGSNSLYNGVYNGYPIDVIQINANLGQQSTYGATLQADYVRQYSSDQSLNLYAAYSYIDGNIDLDESGDLPERNLPGISNHTVKVGGTLKLGAWSFSPRLTVMSNQRVINAGAVQVGNESRYQEVDGFAVMNMHVRWALTKQASLFVTGYNLFDHRYRNVNIGAAPENAAAGSAAVEFAQGAPQNPLRLVFGFKIGF